MKLLGAGNTACVYEIEDNKVIKLFHEGYPEEQVERELLIKAKKESARRN